MKQVPKNKYQVYCNAENKKLKCSLCDRNIRKVIPTINLPVKVADLFEGCYRC